MFDGFRTVDNERLCYSAKSLRSNAVGRARKQARAIFSYRLVEDLLRRDEDGHLTGELFYQFP